MNKKVLIGGAVILIILVLIGCHHDESSSKKHKNVDSNEITLINEDETRRASYGKYEDENYSLNSNNDAKATYKMKVGKNISLKLNDSKYAKLKKVGNGKYNVDMHLDSKKDDHRNAILTFYRKNKEYQKWNIEIDNGIASYVDKQNAEFEKQQKAESEKKKEKENAEYPDFSTKFPNGIANEDNASLLNIKMRFTGKIYGLGANGLGEYIVLLKDKQGNLIYATFKGKLSGKLVVDQELTLYGSSNGLSHVRDQDIDNLGIDSTNIGKNMMLFNADKVKKGEVDPE